MARRRPRPVAPDDLPMLADTIARGVLQAPEQAALVLGWDDADEAMCLSLREDEADLAWDMLLVHAGDPRRRRVLAWASRVAWTNDPMPAPTELSWLVITVARELPALFLVRRERDAHWWTIPPDEVPWFALSTAGSLRKVLDGEDPGPIKRTKDKRMFNKVGEGERPPVDKEGRL